MKLKNGAFIVCLLLSIRSTNNNMDIISFTTEILEICPVDISTGDNRILEHRYVGDIQACQVEGVSFGNDETPSYLRLLQVPIMLTPSPPESIVHKNHLYLLEKIPTVDGGIKYIYNKSELPIDSQPFIALQPVDYVSTSPMILANPPITHNLLPPAHVVVVVNDNSNNPTTNNTMYNDFNAQFHPVDVKYQPNGGCNSNLGIPGGIYTYASDDPRNFRYRQAQNDNQRLITTDKSPENSHFNENMTIIRAERGNTTSNFAVNAQSIQIGQNNVLHCSENSQEGSNLEDKKQKGMQDNIPKGQQKYMNLPINTDTSKNLSNLTDQTQKNDIDDVILNMFTRKTYPSDDTSSLRKDQFFNNEEEVKDSPTEDKFWYAKVLKSKESIIIESETLLSNLPQNSDYDLTIKKKPMPTNSNLMPKTCQKIPSKSSQSADSVRLMCEVGNISDNNNIVRQLLNEETNSKYKSRIYYNSQSLQRIKKQSKMTSKGSDLQQTCVSKRVTISSKNNKKGCFNNKIDVHVERKDIESKEDRSGNSCENNLSVSVWKDENYMTKDNTAFVSKSYNFGKNEFEQKIYTDENLKDLTRDDTHAKEEQLVCTQISEKSDSGRQQNKWIGFSTSEQSAADLNNDSLPLTDSEMKPNKRANSSIVSDCNNSSMVNNQKEEKLASDVNLQISNKEGDTFNNEKTDAKDRESEKTYIFEEENCNIPIEMQNEEANKKNLIKKDIEKKGNKHSRNKKMYTEKTRCNKYDCLQKDTTKTDSSEVLYSKLNKKTSKKVFPNNYTTIMNHSLTEPTNAYSKEKEKFIRNNILVEMNITTNTKAPCSKKDINTPPGDLIKAEANKVAIGHLERFWGFLMGYFLFFMMKLKSILRIKEVKRSRLITNDSYQIQNAQKNTSDADVLEYKDYEIEKNMKKKNSFLAYWTNKPDSNMNKVQVSRRESEIFSQNPKTFINSEHKKSDFSKIPCKKDSSDKKISDNFDSKKLKSVIKHNGRIDRNAKDHNRNNSVCENELQINPKKSKTNQKQPKKTAEKVTLTSINFNRSNNLTFPEELKYDISYENVFSLARNVTSEMLKIFYIKHYVIDDESDMKLEGLLRLQTKKSPQTNQIKEQDSYEVLNKIKPFLPKSSVRIGEILKKLSKKDLYTSELYIFPILAFNVEPEDLDMLVIVEINNFKQFLTFKSNYTKSKNFIHMIITFNIIDVLIVSLSDELEHIFSDNKKKHLFVCYLYKKILEIEFLKIKFYKNLIFFQKQCDDFRNNNLICDDLDDDALCKIIGISESDLQEHYYRVINIVEDICLKVGILLEGGDIQHWQFGEKDITCMKIMEAE